MNLLIVAEIGINHNGDMKIAKSLIALAKNFGATHVKFQKKTPDLCVPEKQKNVTYPTIFGPMKYIDYKKKMEFGKEEYDEINEYCKKLEIEWFASAWDIPSLEFLTEYNVPYIKIPSACITDLKLLKKAKETGTPLIVSTGMSTRAQIEKAIEVLGDSIKYLLHTTSSYPTPNEDMNMRKILTLRELYGDKYKIGFSNHCIDLIYTVQAYILGATLLEFHITLDRNMGGTDQSSSMGPTGFDRIMKHVNNIAMGFGDGKLDVKHSEVSILNKLRK